MAATPVSSNAHADIPGMAVHVGGVAKSSATIIHDIPLDLIDVDFGNDRTVFDESALQALADSSRARRDLMPPIIVRQRASGRYQLVAGERRTRSGRILQCEGALFASFCSWYGLEFDNPFTTIRAEIRDLSDEDVAALMLVENEGRVNLDPIDQAHAYARRMKEYGWDEKTVAARAGVSVQIVRNRLALLSLRVDMQHLVRTGNLTVGYAQIIAEAGLDQNRQLIALRRLNECPSPSPTWLRRQCAELAEQQDSNDMFADSLFAAADFSATVKKQDFKQVLPADPKGHRKEDQAPVIGKTYRQMVENQVKFWLNAADQWDRFGRNAQKDRCLSAASSLQAVVALMPQHGHKSQKVKHGGETLIVYAAAVAS